MQKELKRSSSDSVICGVCGGIAEYFGIDSNVVRLVWVAVSLFAGSGVILYIIAAFLLPKDETEEKDLKDVILPKEKPVDAAWEEVPPEEAADAAYATAAEEEAEPEEPDLKSVIHPEADD